LGKHIIVAYNLKAAKLRGVESRGMLLAASVKHEDGSEAVEVLDAAGIATGTRIKLQGVNDTDGLKLPPDGSIGNDGNIENAKEIDIDTFFSLPISVTRGIVNVNGKAFVADGKTIQTERVKDGEVH
jgi:methionyl-tRNA synthetase